LPEKGLFNGAIGTVIEIVYKPEESPNTGHFPQYVLVDFPTYTGPPFHQLHTTWVPIPTICLIRGKAQIQFVPLELSYARTIHKFQGYQAGPTCDIRKIVFDPGIAKLESIFPGYPELQQ
jgi:ATP-dependent exoDNAse (exonuclease V) alpha subunit